MKQLKADAKARKAQEKQTREAQERPRVDAIERLWTRFGAARLNAGCTVEDVNQEMGRCCTPDDIQKYERLECLDEKVSADTVLPYGPNYYLDVIQRCVKAADLLEVSLDYLLCRIDDSAGSAPQSEGQLAISGWMPGGTTPFQPCDVVADFDLGDGNTTRMTCCFDGSVFRFAGHGETIDLPPTRWMVLPPVEENVSNLDTGEAETEC